MKEIDLLPQWYKESRRQRSSYRTQYIALGLTLALMVVLNFVGTNSLSRARAGFVAEQARYSEAEKFSIEYELLKSKVGFLQERVSRLADIETGIDVSSVLAEISFLVERNVVLTSVNFSAESFGVKSKAKSNKSVLVRASRGGSVNTGSKYIGNVRYKVTLGGVASDAGVVADLICRLEDSAYFCQVIPSYSRNRQINPGGSSKPDGYIATEFEIGCYLANYDELVNDK